MSTDTKTKNIIQDSWHAEFIQASQALEQIIFSKGPEAVYLPEHSELVRTAARHAPPEHEGVLGEMARTVDFVEAARSAQCVINAYGFEALKWPEHAHLVEKMMQNVHPDLVATFQQEAQACGLLPQAGTSRHVYLLH